MKKRSYSQLNYHLSFRTAPSLPMHYAFGISSPTTSRLLMVSELKTLLNLKVNLTIQTINICSLSIIYKALLNIIGGKGVISNVNYYYHYYFVISCLYPNSDFQKFHIPRSQFINSSRYPISPSMRPDHLFFGAIFLQTKMK